MSVIDELLGVMREASETFPDCRKGKNIRYPGMTDLTMAAFSVLFMQNPSFLAHQRSLEKGHAKSNCTTLFGMRHIPSDNHIRAMLDPVEPRLLTPVFDKLLSKVSENGLLGRFQFLGGRTMVAIDATEYHCSYKIHCPHCSHRLRNNGKTEYFHSMVAPVLVGCDHNEVVALPPEFIVPQDGHEKQDCEPVAAQRWLREHAQRMRTLRPVYLGDDIYSRQPMCEAVLASGADFIFVAKPSTHKLVYEYLSGAEEVATLSVVKGRGSKARRWVYRWLNDVPLRDGKNALPVNFVELRIHTLRGEQTYHNSWVTSLNVTAHSVAEIAAAGRARWKVENGNYNILKTKGYHLEHNFGHGRQNLSSLLACMNVLAFAMHTLCHMLEHAWTQASVTYSSRTEFFNALRILTRHVVFPSWTELIDTLSFAQPPPLARVA